MSIRRSRLAIALTIAIGSSAFNATSTELGSVDSTAYQARSINLVDRAAGYAGLRREAGNVHRIAVEVDRDGVPADGQTPVKMVVRLSDATGASISGRQLVTVEADGGRLQLPGAASDMFGMDAHDLDPVTPGFQIEAVDGLAEIWLLAPIMAQSVNIVVSAGGQRASGTINFIPEMRELVGAGVAEGIISLDKRAGLFGNTAGDGFERQIRNFSHSSGDGRRKEALRTSFFLKGAVTDDALLTMAYDSDKPDRQALFRDLDPEHWYPVSGDASIVGFDAQSTSRLYLRLDKGRDYLLWGDIATGTGFSQAFGQGFVAAAQVRDLGQYNRTMTGLRAHSENDRGGMNVFAAYQDQKQVVEEFPGRGLSGPFTVSNSGGAILGSERVELVVRDRNAPSHILSVQQMRRFEDYTFEPFSGRILFVKAVPAVDPALNPMSVRITYEVDQGGDKSWVYGADGQYALGKVLSIGGSYVKDENSLAPYELGSANATVRMGAGTRLVGEYARSQSQVSSLPGSMYSLQPGGALGSPFNPLHTPVETGDDATGAAWRLAFTHQGERLGLRAYYGQSDAAFNNPASSFNGGRKEGGASAEVALTERVSLLAQGTHTEDTISGAKRDSASAGLRFTTGTFSFDGGVNHVAERAGDFYGNGLSVPAPISAPFGVGVVSPGIGGGFYGGGNTALNPATGQTLYNTGYGWAGNYGSWVGNGLAGVPMEYTAVRLAADWRPTEAFNIATELEQDLHFNEHRRASLGAGYRIAENTRAYGRYEWNTGLSSVATNEGVTSQNGVSPYESNAFVWGLTSDYGNGARLFSEYRMYDAFSGRQLQWANGLSRSWRVGEALSLQAGGEKLSLLDGSGEEATAANIGAEWRPSELWSIAGRIEWRGTEGRNVSAAAPQSEGQPLAEPTLQPGMDSWLSTLAVARKLNRNWTVLARNYYLMNDYDGQDAKAYEDRARVGVAYRDTDTNRLNVLARVDYWTRRDAYASDVWSQLAGNGSDQFSDGYDKYIASVHADYHPARPWWLTGHLAGKRQTDYFDGRKDAYTAYLASVRLTYDVSERWDVSGMASTKWSPGGARQNAFGAEVGYLIKDNLWLSAGYNWRGFTDSDLTGGEYTNQGVYLRLRFKFDETLFSGKNPEVNRALPR